MPSTAQNLLHALSDPTRRGLFEHLASTGEQTVHALTDRAGVSQPAVSKHLAALRRAGLVIGRRHGRETYYRPDFQALQPLWEWMEPFMRP
jgi:DNA-binding transcriptional ArsR family regulator